VNGYLLDTNVLSALRRPNSYPRVESWLRSIPSSELRLSVITLGEIRGGIERKRRTDGVQATAIEAWYRQLLPFYGDKILGIDQAIAEKWGCLGINQPLSVADGLIAATALVHGLTLVTRNTPDFQPHGVKVLDPFGI
jgi:predicted nucleic acid-binding protein